MELASITALAPEETDFEKRAHALGPVMEKYTAQIEETKRLPQELLDGLHDAGLFRMLLPRAYGGFEVSPTMFAKTM
ncbi:MAG: hypothetical protein JKY94_00210, partial [Rhodobacteraceae bacterium]|nr:hypothetical protein [Paracoccaceae bacterium]